MKVKKTAHNQAFLFMFQQIREIVVRLFSFYLKRKRERTHEREKNAVRFIFFLPSYIYDNMAALCTRTHPNLTPSSGRPCGGGGGSSNIKMPFSIFPLLREMNFVSIILNTMRCAHDSGKAKAFHCIHPYRPTPRCVIIF